MLRLLALVLLIGLSTGAVLAQTEDDLVRYATESKARVAAGEITELDHYREIYRRVAQMPPSYQFKAENLRMIGERASTF